MGDHAAVAALRLEDEALVQAVLTGWRTAPVSSKVKSALEFLEKLTLYPEHMETSDLVGMRAEGITDRGIEEVIHVCFVFSLMDRLADAFDFEIPSPEQVKRNGRALLKQGYWGDSIPG